MNDEIVIKTTRLRYLDTETWNKVKGKITSWKGRFEAIENVLAHSP